MGCCSYKSQQSILSSQSTIVQQIDSQFLINQSRCDINFFLNVPLNECKKFLKQVNEKEVHSIKEQQFNQHMYMLNTLTKIVKKLQILQKNSLVGLDSDILGNSGDNSSPLVRNKFKKVNGYTNNSDLTPKQNGSSSNQSQQTPITPQQKNIKQTRQQFEQQRIVDMVVQRHSQYIDLKQPELKILLESCNLSYYYTQQTDLTLTPSGHQIYTKLYSLKLKVSVFYDKILMEGQELTQKCNKSQSQQDLYQKEMRIQLDKYIPFLLTSKSQNLSDQEFCKNNYILFEIFTQQSSKSQYFKEKEQKIPFEELISQNPINKTLKFFRDEDMNQNSLIIKFDLELRTQLIYKQKQFLDSVLKESQYQKIALGQAKDIYLKRLRKFQLSQDHSEISQASQNSFNNPERQNEDDNHQNPMEIFYSLFQTISSPSHSQKNPRSIFSQHNNSQFIVDLQEGQSRLSAFEYQESYSCQFQNQYMMEEEEDEDDSNPNTNQQEKNIDIAENNTELLQNQQNLQVNNENIKKRLMQSTDNDQEIDINQIQEQLNQSQKLSFPIYQLNDSLINVQQCQLVIEQDEKSSCEDLELKSSEIFQNDKK